MQALVDRVPSRRAVEKKKPASAPALRRLLADGLVRADAAGNLTAIGPEEARAHLDLLWDRLFDVDTRDQAAPSGTA